jgi:hypothetical protein
MAERLSIEITGDAQQLIAALNKSSQAVKAFGAQAKGGAGGVGALTGELKGLAASLGFGVTLAGTVAGLGAFVKTSYEAAAAAERLGRANENLAQTIGASSSQMVGAIQSASSGTISSMDAMAASNKALMFGLVETPQQMAELTRVAVTLGQAMGQGAGKSIDDLTIALGRQSPLILDNLGITLKLEQAYQGYANTLGKSVDQLTEAEKKQAFVAEALRIGTERANELGGVTVDTAGKTEQLTAAWSDFTVEFGKLTAGPLTDAVGLAVDLVTMLREGAVAWQGIGEMAGMANDTADARMNVENLRLALVDLQMQEAALQRAAIVDPKSAKDLEAVRAQIAILSTEMRGLRTNTDLTDKKSQLAARALANERQAADNLANSLRGASAASARYAAAADAIAIKQARAAAAQRGVQRRRDDRSEEYASFGGLSAAEVEAATSRAQGGESIGSSIGQSMGQSIADTLRSAVESQIRPTLDEVWQPGGEETRIDEWGRRAATIMTQGLGSEWISQLNSQFAGTDFWTPIQDALAAGDTGTAQNLLGNLLTQNPSALWDKELIKQRVRDSMAQEGIKDEFISTIVQELQAEGLNVNLAQVTGAMGVGGGMGMAAQDPEKQAAAMADPATQTFGAFSTAFIAVAGESDIMMQLGRVMAAGAATVDMKPAATSLMGGLTAAIKDDAAFKSTFMTIIIQTLVGQGYIAQPRAGR